MPNNFLELISHAADVQEQRKRMLEERLFQQKHYDAMSELEKEKLRIEQGRSDRAEAYQTRMLDEAGKQREFENKRQTKSDALQQATAVHSGVIRPIQPGTPLDVPGIVGGLPQVAPQDQGKPTVEGEGNQQFVPVSPEESETARLAFDKKMKDQLFQSYLERAKGINLPPEEANRLALGAMMGHEIKPPTSKEDYDTLTRKAMESIKDPKDKIKFLLDRVRAYTNATESQGNAALQEAQMGEVKLRTEMMKNENNRKIAADRGHQAFTAAWDKGMRDTKGKGPLDPAFETSVSDALQRAHAGQGYHPDPDINNTAHGFAMEELRNSVEKAKQPKQDFLQELLKHSQGGQAPPTLGQPPPIAIPPR